MKQLFTKCRDLHNAWDIDVYMREQRGYQSVEIALKMDPKEIVNEVKISNLRGRGGAGFPTGVKWSFMPATKPGVPKYLVINADEGEPGTFKDRLILEYDPHRLVEGCIGASWTLGANACYIYIRGELRLAIDRVENAIKQAYAKGFLGKNILGTGYDLDMYVHMGAGAYICGEETALLESLEGKQGQPRMKPPYPATVGLFSKPTMVNNVETVAALPTILLEGGEAFAKDGCERNGGIKLYCISGHVVRPGVYEAPHGISMHELIYSPHFCQGVRNGKKIKAVIPGGSSCPVVRPDPSIDFTNLDAAAKVAVDRNYGIDLSKADLDPVDLRKISMDFDAVRKVGTLFGTGGIVVMDEDTCMVRVAANLAHFYHFESCGQCTPCREGTGWVARVLDNLEEGRGTPADLELLMDVCDNIEGNTICPHGDAAAMAVRSYIQNFRDEFKEHISRGGCWFPSWNLPGSSSAA